MCASWTILFDLDSLFNWLQCYTNTRGRKQYQQGIAFNQEDALAKSENIVKSINNSITGLKDEFLNPKDIIKRSEKENHKQ